VPVSDDSAYAAIGPARPVETVVESIVAMQLHVADVVSSDDGVHIVTSLRIQGAPPEICVEFAGVVGRRHYPAAAQVRVVRRRRRL